KRRRPEWSANRLEYRRETPRNGKRQNPACPHRLSPAALARTAGGRARGGAGAGWSQRSLDRLCGGVEAEAEPFVIAAQFARHLLDRRGCRPHLRRSRPARRAYL